MYEMKVLIVEDESISALWLKSMLKTLGFKVIGLVGNGEDAVTKALTLLPDLIFLDIRLAGSIDGVEAARRINEQKHIPLIFLTAYPEEIYTERLRNIPSIGVIKKPFGADDLEEFLQKHNLLNSTENRISS